jgi:ABC-type branched-subunit amino acid transport system substrate-binding protein
VGRRGRLRRALAVAVALALLTACGARLDDEQQAALAAAAAGDPFTPGGVATGERATDGASSDGGTGAGAGAGGPGGVAGPAGEQGSGGGPTGPAADDCTPQPVDEVGVTDDEIVLGNVSMLSGPIPGAGQTGIDGTRAYLEHINSQGGVCGRHLRLITGDDRTDSGQNRSEARRLSGQAFGLVGGASIVDAGTAEAVAGTDVPVIQVAVADNALASPNIFSPSPLDPTNQDGGSIPHWRHFNRTLGLQRVGIVVVSLASARSRAAVYVKDIENAGLEVAGVHEVGLAETNFVSVAQQLVNEGADGFIGLLDPVGSARLAKAVKQVGWHPLVAHYGAQNYGRPFVELAGEAAEGAVVPLAFDIFEDADTNPAVARFMEWFARTAPGHTPDFYGAMGWASADMMVEALRAAGPAPTRKAVLAHLRALTSFDAHGFLAPCNPAGKVTSPYFMVAVVRNGQWERMFPASGFSDGT